MKTNTQERILFNKITVLAMSILMSAALLKSSPVFADVRDQAKRAYDRIAGVPPTEQTLNDMVTAINAAPDENGFIATMMDFPMQDKNFYNVTLKNLITPWTNEEQTVFAPLNDFTATAIGLIRDEYDFRTVLSDNVIYIGHPSLNLTGYSNSNNNHYEELEDSGADLSSSAILVRQNQSDVTGLPSEATAGIMTTRAAAKAFFVAGTNRAMFRFTLLNFLCNDLEQFKDTTRPADRIRQDVTRSPGGDSRIFMNQCLGCHSGMDPMAQAFAYYEWSGEEDTDDGELLYTQGDVQDKYHINSGNFKWGYSTPNDTWTNYWRKGPNSEWVGWGWGPEAIAGTDYATGDGAKSLGVELANTELFAQCQAKKVFKTVCLRDPVDSSDHNFINTDMVNEFSSSNGNMKRLFGQAAYYCRGE